MPGGFQFGRLYCPAMAEKIKIAEDPSLHPFWKLIEENFSFETLLFLGWPRALPYPVNNGSEGDKGGGGGGGRRAHAGQQTEDDRTTAPALLTVARCLKEGAPYVQIGSNSAKIRPWLNKYDLKRQNTGLDWLYLRQIWRTVYDILSLWTLFYVAQIIKITWGVKKPQKCSLMANRSKDKKQNRNYLEQKNELKDAVFYGINTGFACFVI